ncbi:hypothetical protein vseg_005086 [Gypsophila vaccaria]
MPETDALPADYGGRVESGIGLSEFQVFGAPTRDRAVVKRRGRPPSAAAKVTAVSKRSKKVDEDVCFVCFDGGSLVLCDHRDCPKAYHPACIKRDESFFVPDIRWICGWHLCNKCQKNALFMCYTCPSSYCKGCVKQVDILCVRGNKGFCRPCMSTIMLLEKIPLENKELAPVDFDDTTSWEYLFKVYWIYLKEKEALTLDQLIRASNPWKVNEVKSIATFKQKARDTYFSNSSLRSEANNPKRIKTRKQQPLIMDSQKIDKAASNKVPGLLGQPDWASKELLEFVAYAKNGDLSTVSEFDVQTLLLDYIKNHNLRDPRQKCQIICDKRLENLFGKERVGHFEMLRLLENHFKKESSANCVIRGAAMNPLSGLLKEGLTVDSQTPCSDTRRQIRRNKDDRGRQINLGAFAAIDAHNINLIYLKRGLLETLMLDAEKFHDKVVGSVVRIKLSSNDQKRDMHRLVRVIGTSKATKLYKLGDQMVNIMLKILNLNKVEDVTINAISDREFSEDECRRLRQSIKLGLVERMTVGEIQEKAMALQAVKVSNWLELEIRKLNHLRDQASERGQLKKLRDFVEKIELLKTPEERQRRIHSTPDVHADPRMDPSYGSDDSGEGDIKRNGHLTPKHSNSCSKSMELNSSGTIVDISKVDRARTLKAATANEDCKKKYPKLDAGKVEGVLESLKPSWKTERPNTASRVLEPDNRTNLSVASGNHGAATIDSSFQANSNPQKATSNGMLVVSDITELEKIWLYQDPSGKVQGPFCILQLRKWDSNGCFPNDLKVWRSNETCNQSILLNDALKKQQSSEPRSNFQSQNGAKIDDEEVYSIGVMNSNSVTSRMSNQTNEECSKSNLTDTASVEQSVNGYNRQPDSVKILKAQLIESLFDIEEPSSDATVEGSPEMIHVSLKSEPCHPSNGMSVSDNVAAERLAVKSGPPSPNAGLSHPETSLHVASEGIEASEVLGAMPDLNGDNPKDLHVYSESHSKSDVCKDFRASSETRSGVMEVSDMPTPFPKTQNEDKHDRNRIVKHCTGNSHEQNSWVDNTFSGQEVHDDGMICQDAENIHSISLHVPRRDSGTRWSTASTSALNEEEIKANTVENKYYTAFNVSEQGSGTGLNAILGESVVFDLPITSLKSETDCLKTPITESKSIPAPNLPSQDSGISWNNIFGGELHLPDVASEWGWQTIELNTLGDESVSDLLSEVEAMESLRGTSSQNSMMNCTDHPGDECFSPLDGLSLNLDLRINDSLISTADIHPHQHFST